MRTLTAEHDALPHLNDPVYRRLKAERRRVTRRLLKNGLDDPCFEWLIGHADRLDKLIAQRKARCLENIQ